MLLATLAGLILGGALGIAAGSVIAFYLLDKIGGPRF